MTCSYPGEELNTEAWEALGVTSGQEELKGDIASQVWRDENLDVNYS